MQFMSRNVLLAIIIIVVVFLALLLFSRRGTNTQTGFISPTPVDETIPVTEEPVMEISPTTEVTVSPAVLPTGTTTTVSPATAQ